MNKSDLKEFSIRDTNVLKGLALLLLLFHHLWYQDTNADLNGNGVIDGMEAYLQLVSISGKLCVSIFVFLSGYGLAKSYRGDLKYYFVHRFTKLYLSYWLIWVMFVPLGILFFNITFIDVYRNHVAIRAIIDFLGLSKSFGFYGYNATWWFYSCIILLYSLFPFIHKTFKYWYVWVLVGILFAHGISLLSNRIGALNRLWIFIEPITPYFGVFIWGSLISHFNIISWFKKHQSLPILIVIMIIFVLISYFRLKAGWGGTVLDPYLVVLLVFVYASLYGVYKLKSIFAFLGKHSLNIFLFHTFIFSMYFHDFVYYTENPIIQFFSLLVSSLVISIFIEKIKDIIHMNSIEKWIENKICRIL